MINARITIHSKMSVYKFKFKIHKSLSPANLQIEEKFYKNTVPIGTHHEIEILIPNKEIIKNKGYCHYHFSEKTEKIFVYWTGHLPELKQVEVILPLWCQGNVYSIESGEDFAGISEKHDIHLMDFNKMNEIFVTNYGIKVFNQIFPNKIECDL